MWWSHLDNLSDTFFRGYEKQTSESDAFKKVAEAKRGFAMCGPQFSMHFSLNFNSATVIEKSVPTTKEGDKRANGIFP